MIRAVASAVVLLVLIPAAVFADRDSRPAREAEVFTLQDAAQTSPIDVTNVTNEGNQSSNSTSVTTTVGNNLLLSLPKWETATWSSYGTGETEDMAPTSSDMGWTAGSYKNAASTAGTETMTINISSSRDVDETVVAVKSAGSSASSVTVTETYTYAGTDYANPHAVTQIGNGVSTTTFAYDNNGNLVQKIARSGGNATTTLHTWDYANRLLQTAIGNTSTTTTSYGYDAFGSRVFMGVNGATTTYPSRYFSRVFSITGATTTATTTSYLFSGDTLLATFEGGQYGTTTRYSHADHLGSTNLVTNASGTAILQTLDYFPFGSIRTNTKTAGTDSGRKYINRFYDDSSSLSYLQARYYSSDRGQFISQDPMFWSAGQNLADPQSLNSYSYANDNPINRSDPSGLLSKKTPENVIRNLMKSVFSLAQSVKALVTYSINNPSRAAQNVNQAARAFVNNPLGTVKSGATNIFNNTMRSAKQTVADLSSGDDEKQEQAITDAILLIGSFATPQSRAAAQANNAEKVYRVFGGEAKLEGKYWTPTNPASVENFRNSAGLPPGNTGRFVAEGTVDPKNILSVQQAAGIGPNSGGLTEYVIDWKNVKITNISGANPDF